MEPNKLFIDLTKKATTKSERIIIDFILKYKHKAIFMTARQISKEVNVGASTVVRLAKTLGYKTFSDMQLALQDEFINHNLRQRFEYYKNIYPENESMKSIIDLDIQNIQNTHSYIELESFNKIIKTIGEVNEIYTIGFGSSAVDAHYLGVLLQRTLNNTITITTTGVILDKCLQNSSNKSIVFVFSFPRYIKQTIKIAKYLKENNNVFLILITDSLKSPLIDISDCFLLVSIESNISLYSHTASINLINTIVDRVEKTYKERVKENIDKLEKYFHKSSIFYL